MNLFIITSAINSTNSMGVFSSNDRFLQTLNTISSIRKNIPNSLIYIADITDLCDNYIQQLSSLTDKFISCSGGKHLSKSIGEQYILQTVLSLHLPELQVISNIFKLSGRYYLNDNFNISDFVTNKYNFLRGDLCYHTTLFSIPHTYVQDFILALSNTNKYIDIEHALYSTINTNNINFLNKLNCEGFYFHGLQYSA
jgi:hypothetical protein